MYKTTILFGSLLILLGLIAYFATGSQSITALIPTFFGIPVLLLGVVARNEKWHKHAMHVTLVLALLGLIGSFSGIPKTIALIGGDDILRPQAAITQTIMALLCFGYFLLGIRSFIEARRKN